MRHAYSPHLTRRQAGYTLLELLVYVAIVGALLTAVTMFFGVVVDARVKNQSIAEVNDQGTAAMDYLTQTVRNATSITSPAAAAVGPSLTLVVPTGGLSPSIFDTSGSTLGYNGAGTATDVGDSNNMLATKFTPTASGTITTLYAYVSTTVAASPNNKAQVAIYSGTTSLPTALLGSTPSTVLRSKSWVAFALPSPVSVTSGQTYWLAYNANGLVSGDNNIQYHPGTASQTQYTASGQVYGSWPNSWSGLTLGAPVNSEFCLYAPIFATGSPSQLRIKEGAGAAVPLTNSKVEVTGLSFTNLTRAGTNGVVQIVFTVSRVNPNNKNEYDYQKTFTESAEVGW